LSDRDLESLFAERGFDVDHATIKRWALAYAPMIEKRLRRFRRQRCGSIRVDETIINVRGEWRTLFRAVDKHETPVDFPLPPIVIVARPNGFPGNRQRTNPRCLRARSARTEPRSLLWRSRMASPSGFSSPASSIASPSICSRGNENDHFRVKQIMPEVGGFRSFATARRRIGGFEAMIWLCKGFGFFGDWTVRRQNELLALCFRVLEVNKV
jgi:transposase-like protein